MFGGVIIVNIIYILRNLRILSVLILNVVIFNSLSILILIYKLLVLVVTLGY